ncbi:MAG: hypothetical protein KJO07_02110 [Deltaproteobacteria bacterium]|jgi:hypothetical protein|nr:hypothetical protein [Deltaproteobacteria bacterium]
MSDPWYAYLLLYWPKRVRRHLEQVRSAGVVSVEPNTWQLCLGALRMWHRLLYRPDSVGTSSGPAPRRTVRARLMHLRALRLPVLLAEGAVAPWDFTGLFSSPERLTRHLLGAHHDAKQFVFDLQLLAAHPGQLEALEERAKDVVEGRDPRAEWLRDLVVFEGYHENLLAATRRARDGHLQLSEEEARNPDLTLTGLLEWCAAAPETPAATIAAMRRGSFALGPRGDARG